MEIKVWTDGATSKNGRKGARGGVGVWFGLGDPRNVSEPFPHPGCQFEGPATNQKCELYAIYRCLEVLQGEPGWRNMRVRIVSDSDYSIKCITVWAKNWIRNGWKNAKGNMVANQGIIKAILNMRAFFESVEFTHVNSHTGKKDELSLGNAEADRLATAAVKHDAQPATSKKRKSVEEHNVAKKVKNESSESRKNAAQRFHEHVQKKKWKYEMTINETIRFPSDPLRDDITKFGASIAVYLQTDAVKLSVQGYPNKKSAKDALLEKCWKHILAHDGELALDVLTESMSSTTAAACSASSANGESLTEQDVISMKATLKALLVKRMETTTPFSQRECDLFLRYHKNYEEKYAGKKAVTQIRIAFTDKNSRGIRAWACVADLGSEIVAFSLKKIVWKPPPVRVAV